MFWTKISSQHLRNTRGEMEGTFARALRGRLRDEAHPYKRRLKLCQKLTKVTEISQSENINCVILEWIAGSLSLQGKVPVEETTLRQWKMFHSLLKSILQQDTVLQDLMVIRRYLPSKFFQLMANWLSQLQNIPEDMQTQIVCCSKIAIQNKKLLETQLLNFEDFSSFLSAVIVALSQANKYSISSDLLDILNLLLEKNHISRILQADREIIFGMCVQNLLKPVAQLLLKHSQGNNNNENIELIKTALGSFLFSKSLERHFKQMLNGLLLESFPDDCPQFLKSFLFILQEEFKDNSSLSNKMAVCLPVILEEFLAQYKNLQSHEKFHFVALLVRLLGIKATNPDKDYFKNNQFFAVSFSDNESGFSILADILIVFGKHPDIYQGTDAVGIKPTEWIQDLMHFLLRKTQERCKSWFRCLHAMLVIDNKIITSNFQLICDVAWLSHDQLEFDVQQAQSLFFCEVITTFAKLQQSTNFIDRIINTLSVKIGPIHFKQFHLPIGVLEKFDVICATLSSGQVLHSWKSFTNYVINYYIPRMSDLSGDVQVVRHCICPVLELMSSFLINVQFVEHIINIPHMVKDFITYSISTSKSCVMPLLLESLTAKDVILLRNTLNLAYSWGEAHLKLLNYIKVYVQLWKEETNDCISLTDAFSDLTSVHFYIGANEWHLIYKVCVESEEPVLQFMFAKLVAQKIKALLSIKKSEIVSNAISSAAGYFVTLLKTCDEKTLWDKKISSINEANLPVALWALFCENLPIVVPYLSSSDIMTVARIMISTFKEDIMDVFNQSYITRSLTSSQHINELIEIQSALTVASFEEVASIIDSKQRKIKNGKVLWKKIYEVFHIMSSTPEMWLQYANSTPMTSANGLNPLWSMIKDAANILSNAFQLSVNEEDLNVSAKHLPLQLLMHQLMFLDQLPVEFFSPGNQMHCLIGIFTLLIPAVHCTHCDVVLVECIIQCLKTVIALVDSLRSNWLFDLIQVQDLFLWIFGPFTTFQTQLSEDVSISIKIRNEFRTIGRQFLDVMLNLVRGNSNVFHEFDKFLAQVELLPTWQQVTDYNGKEQIISYAVNMLQLFHDLQRSSNKSLQSSCQNYISRISKSLINWSFAYINADNSMNDSERPPMMTPLLEGFNILLEFQMNTDKEVLLQHSQNFKRWKKLIPEVKGMVSQISNFSKDLKNVEICCRIMCNFCKHRDSLKKYISNDIFQETWKVVEFYLQSLLLLKQPLSMGFLEQLISFSHINEFYWLLKTVLNAFDVQQIQYCNVDRVEFVLHVWNKFASIPLTCERKIVLEKHSQKFMILCQHALYQVMEQDKHSWELAIFIIEVQANLIKNTKMTAGRLTLCLQGCAFVDLLQIDDYLIYGKFVDAICLLLNNMLIKSINILRNMVPPFIAAVQDVMKSVIHKGQQQLLKDAPEDDAMLVCQCAQNIERLLAQIAVSSLDFTKVSSYIIANFVTESSGVTLYPAVKNYLTEGIYSIMQLCEEHAIAALQASLNDTARQVFNSLHGTYIHYYQYKGKV